VNVLCAILTVVSYLSPVSSENFMFKSVYDIVINSDIVCCKCPSKLGI